MNQTSSPVATPENANAAPAGGTLDIQRIYIKEQSCKVPHAPGIYQQQSAEVKPETGLEMNIQNQALEEGHFEVTLKLHLTLKFAQQTAMVIEVQQAGVFKFGAFDATQQAFLLGAYCPGVLFPYARKAVSDLAGAAGFLPITLPAINFDAMYQQRQKQAQETGSQKKVSEATPIMNEKINIQ